MRNLERPVQAVERWHQPVGENLRGRDRPWTRPWRWMRSVEELLAIVGLIGGTWISVSVSPASPWAYGSFRQTAILVLFWLWQLIRGGQLRRGVDAALERQPADVGVALRYRAYRTSYWIVAAVLAANVAYVVVALEYPGWGWPLPQRDVDFALGGVALVVLVLVLPTHILAWMVPDPPGGEHAPTMP